jgi:hypothetical protein
MVDQSKHDIFEELGPGEVLLSPSGERQLAAHGRLNAQLPRSLPGAIAGSCLNGLSTVIFNFAPAPNYEFTENIQGRCALFSRWHLSS